MTTSRLVVNLVKTRPAANFNFKMKPINFSNYFIPCFLLALSFNSVYCLTDDEKEILNWKAPAEMQETFPYEISGFDNDGAPVMAIKFGQWNIRAFIEKGGSRSETIKMMDKYVRQLVVRMVMSPKLYGDETTPDEFTVIADIQGYDLTQLLHPPTVQIFIKGTQLLTRYISSGRALKSGIGVNGNFLFETLLSLTRPIFGGFFSKLKVYPSNPSKWIPQLRKDFPKDQLPEWLGGSKDQKPIATYG